MPTPDTLAFSPDASAAYTLALFDVCDALGIPHGGDDDALLDHLVKTVRKQLVAPAPPGRNEPARGSVVIDREGDAWQRSTSFPVWNCIRGGQTPWGRLVQTYGPVTLLVAGPALAAPT